MTWLRRSGEAPPIDDRPAAEARPARTEGAAPGVAALLDGVSEDRSHAVLDLGPASDLSLRVYSRFARWIRFADLLGEAWWPHAQESAAGLLKSVVLPEPGRPYDLIFAWDILDRLFPADRPRLAEWLGDVTGPGTRLHAVVRAAEHATMLPLRFALLDVDRIRYEPTGPAPLQSSRLLPAEVGRVLAPLQVVHAFTLKTGLREYVAVRR